MFKVKANKQLQVLEDLANQNAATWRKQESFEGEGDSICLPTPSSRTKMSQLLSYAALPISPTVFLILSVLSGVITTALTMQILSSKLMIVYLIVGMTFPFLYAEKRIKDRANRFTEDYSTMLMAAASSIKVGLTPYHALERSVNMLSKDSLVKLEVNTLLQKLRNGSNRDSAISEFASSIRQPDIELFRSAFILVLDNGGRFAPTLSRLASVSYGRMSLIRSALVSTANMRMTANFLLFAVPVLLLMMSVKTPNYWTVLFHDPQANTFASIGITMILASYAVLRQFSNFKP